MILLDTNIISEALKPGGDPKVKAWLDAQALETLVLSTITLAELAFGIAAMPTGERRTRLRRALDEEITPLFDGRILSFDRPAAEAYGELRARARSLGKAISTADGYIAAIATAHHLAVATRDVSPFEAAQVQVISP